MAPIVVMGVSGSGKSTVGAALAQRLRVPFADADDFHPEANIAKMSSGTPLTDEDRWPWLDLIAEWTAEQDGAGKNTVVTCSALRRIYRDRLRNAPGRTLFVHLVGSPELLEHRLSSRSGHFMPPTLLPSQLATLEPLEADEEGVILDVYHSIDNIAQLAINQLHLAQA